MKNFFAKNWTHFIVIAFFLILTITYFSPAFNGYGLKQHDIEQFSGMAHETVEYRNKTGNESLWTNSMFGGMPTTQISVAYTGNLFQKTLFEFVQFFNGPSSVVLIHLIGFYILALCLGLNPIVGVIGAIAVSFSSYEIIILTAGHNTKAIAVALIAPTVGAFLMAYRRNWKWGAILSALFMSYQLAANHLQVTYYMAFLLGGLGAYELFNAIKTKEFKKFLITTSSVIGAYLLAFIINYGNISLTNDYSKHTIRSANDVTITPDGTTSKVQSSGLDKDYITNWSYGIGESFTLLSPNVKGAATVQLGGSQFEELADNSEELSAEDLESAKSMAVYWGDQPMTSGPAFIGVIVIFLSLLGMIYLKDKSKWVLLAVSILCLVLSWGKNFMGLTDFFIDNVPGYNKFRTVTIILVIVEFCLPLIAVLFLDQLIKEREVIKENKKPFLIASASLFVFIIGMKVMGLGDHYSAITDNNQLDELRANYESSIMQADPAMMLSEYQIDVTNRQQVSEFIEVKAIKVLNAIKEIRKEIYNSSLSTTLLILFFAIGLVALLFYTSVSTVYVYVGLAILVMVELIPVDKNYLSSELLEDEVTYKYWTENSHILFPSTSEPADDQILASEIAQNKAVSLVVSKAEKEGNTKANDLEYTGADKDRVVNSYKFMALNNATNYRVFDMDGGFGSARASYFHKSLGGYHGAKLRNIQNVYDFHLSRSNNKVLNMLNVKYFIQKGQLQPNPEAMGNAWLVRSVRKVKSPNEEILALGNKFKLENIGKGAFLVNGEVKSKAFVYGSEKIQYLNAGQDTLDVPVPNGISKGMKALFVMDANGKTELIRAETQLLDTANSFKQFVSIEIENEFNVNTEAVMLDSEAKKLSATTYSGNGTIKMTSYAPNKLVYKASVQTKQLIVFSEVYYNDGWKAFVDNKEVDICKVNYLLRGVEVSKGDHTIEFKFDLPKFHKANMYSLIGSVIVLSLIVVGIWSERKKKMSI